MRTRVIVALTMALALIGVPVHGEPGSDLFKKREITIQIGAGAGGGADIYARLLSRHFGRHLPGNPTIVAKNLPGAGGLRLANQLYNVAPKDGTELGLFLSGTALEPLFGNKEAKFETTKFTWIGNMDSDATVCFVGKHTGVRGWEDLKKRETTFGASGPASVASIQAKIMGEILGAKVRVIHGYQGTRTSLLAMQRGELDGVCGIYMSTVRSQFERDLAAGEMNVFIAFDRNRIKEFPQVPTIFETIKGSADRQLAELIFGQNALSRPVSAPPGLNTERRLALRTGLLATMKDSALLAEATKLRLEIVPMSGEETERRFQSFYELPAAVVARARAIIGGR